MSAPSSEQAEERRMEAVFQVKAMSSDISEIKVSIREMALAIGKLAVFEERQMNDRQTIGSVIETLKDHSGRITHLELAQPLQKQAADWVNKVVWIVIGVVVSALLASVVVSRTPDLVSRTTSTTTETNK
jgi:hypothetical protein